MEPNHLTLEPATNPAYGVVTAADEDLYHVYDTIPDAPKVYEVPIKGNKLQVPIQPHIYND